MKVRDLLTEGKKRTKEQIKSELAKVNDRIEAIVKDGGRVPMNDPLTGKLKKLRAELKAVNEDVLETYDDFDIELNEQEMVSTYVRAVTEHAVYLYADDQMMEALAEAGIIGEEVSDEAHELMLYAENDADLYRQSYVPVAKNLEKKYSKGVYDPELAKKLWKYHADRAAAKYGMDHGNGDGLKIFSPSVRREVAAQLQADHYAEMEAGNFHESISESSSTDLRDKDDYKAKRKAIQDLQMDPATAKDPKLKAEVIRRKAELEKQASEKGFNEASKDEETDFHTELDKLVHNTFGKRKDESITEAEYQGRDVPLGKRMQGDVKKFKVYVKNAKGNVVKVNFGDPNMRIKKSNPARRKSFRARHNCANPGPRWKARYWSCRAW